MDRRDGIGAARGALVDDPAAAVLACQHKALEGKTTFDPRRTAGIAAGVAVAALAAVGVECSRGTPDTAGSSGASVSTRTATSAPAGLRPAPRPAEGAGPVAADPDPSTLVIAHSFTGHTAVVGREIAAMLGARFIRVRGRPPAREGVHMGGGTPPLPKIDLTGVKRVFLGFPVWGLAPSPQAVALLSSLDLRGIQVELFYTFLHGLDPASLESLRSTVISHKGTWLEPIPIRVPLATTRLQLLRMVHRAVLSRSYLWSPDTPGPPKCAPGPDRRIECHIPAGRLWLGDVGAASSPPGYVSPRLVSVGAFDIDQSEVTIDDYRRCEKRGACPRINVQNSFCRELVKRDGKRPMPCVSFADAKAFCHAMKMRIPTEAEWIRAARGATARAFPWGNDPPTRSSPLFGNFGEKAATGLPHYSVVSDSADWPSDGFPGLSPVCRFKAGRSPWGVCDLAGNLAEWTTLGRSTSGPPILKGGSWLDGEASSFLVGARARISLEHPDVAPGFYITGFRCVRPTG